MSPTGSQKYAPVSHLLAFRVQKLRKRPAKAKRWACESLAFANPSLQTGKTDMIETIFYT